MSASDSDMEECKNDPRIPCKYGAKCYQKNPAHHSKYKHPSKSNKRKINLKDQLSKKPKLDGDKKDDMAQTSKNTEVHANEDLDEIIDEIIKNETKKEYISDSSNDSIQNQSEDETETEEKSTGVISDAKAFIKENFLVEMPNDFYDFWKFCKELRPNNPCEAFRDVGLKLVGTFDVLAGNFNHVKKSPEDFLRHWRYYYDPPELQTVLKGDNSTGYHIGYFFDSPDEPPAFLVSNNGTKSGVITKMGDNIFAAVYFYLEDVKKTSDPFKKMRVGKLLNSVKNRAEKLKLNVSAHSEKIKKRDNKIVTKTSNKVGLVVPYNKKTQLGYRDLAVSDKELLTLLTKLAKALPEQKPKILSDLQPVFTYADIALDECDFGTGLKLAWELLYHGIDSLDSTILRFFTNSYTHLKRDAFIKIAKAHLTSRKKGCDLSIL